VPFDRLEAAKLVERLRKITPMTISNGYALISPCRNEAAYMRQTLDSVIGQTVRPAKWVIVDDGSTDETPQILLEYRRQVQLDRGRDAKGSGAAFSRPRCN
jgi:glycosyltransferase involved in cell wall biosynthesis